MSEPFVSPRPPWPSRAVDRVIGGLQRLGLGRDWLDPSLAISRARQRTGLHALGMPGHQERMDRLVESLEREASLTSLGRLTMRSFLEEATCNRLQLTEVLRRHPEIERIPVERPIFIVGWPRTGTTALHDLMSLDPALYAPCLWELRRPVPTGMRIDGEQRERRKLGDRAVVIGRRLAPGLTVAHPMHADMPDECQFLFDNDVFTALFIAFQADDYGRWMLSTDAAAFYRSYRQQLQVLLWSRPPGAARRLVLKWPFHLWHLSSLLEVFPDACVIQTHRALDRALPSLCNLTAIIQSAFNHRVDPLRIGAQWLPLSAEGIERGMAARQRVPVGARFYDMVHRRLVEEHVAEVERIYEALALSWPSGMAERIRRYLREQPRGHSGRHHYRMEWFGLRSEAIAERFGGYLRWSSDLDPGST
ncbi:sulfotransferase family protein [Paraliomyxa miuraensis]|uniref:sulfotransferase family protein n=1 Tax=Paraliomyxa miuraensis TaxID=376150 RepID=UPI00224F169A|nr:sulfotransferase [Paraliomyxa miuraensis]MCX4241411.1 sulfotransferase [Paraliomyxa miuraensis]